MRPGISYTPQGKPYMPNPGSFAFGRAQPKSSDKQQGQLAEPPKQSGQASQQQSSGARATGDYSAYSIGGSYAPSQQAGSNDARTMYGGAAPYADGRSPRQDSQMRYRQDSQAGGEYRAAAPGNTPTNSTSSYGYSGPGSSPMEQMPTVRPPQGGTPRQVMIDGAPAAVLDPMPIQREIDSLIKRGTWDDPRNYKARERLQRELADRQSVPPGYFRAPDGSLEVNRIYTGMPMPPSQQQPPAPQPGQFQRPTQYGSGLNMPPGGMITSDFRDSGGDGIDDRFQTGPGQPPPAFTSQTNYAPPQSYVMPTQMTPQGMPDFRQRDAFIASINDSLGRQMSFGTPTPQPPQLNFPTLWQQAGQMVNNGWQNPLAGLFT
jgi:hypothetical protein